MPNCVVGIDIGSSYTKAVILSADGKILSHSTILSGAAFEGAANDAFAQALERARLEESDIGYIISTGYGRNLVSFADESITEINCHAFGAKKVCPECRTVIDIGGQDSKIIHVDENGWASRFVMNDKCAAGTGRFLEVMFRVLDVSYEEANEMSFLSRKRLEVSSMCTVFAESEVISLLAQGNDKIDILAAIFRSIGRRIVGLSSQVGIIEKVVMTGGVAKGAGLLHVLEEKLRTKILAPPDPQINGAFGAAAIALERRWKADIETPFG